MPGSKKYWSAKVTSTSNAMDLPSNIFNMSSKRIAIELKKAVMRSNRTKGTKFQSAMSMLNFYINRAGKNLNKIDRDRLERAKNELRKAFHKQTK